MLKRNSQKYIFKHIGNQDRQCIHQKEWHNIVTAEVCRRTMINWILWMAALCRYCTLLASPRFATPQSPLRVSIQIRSPGGIAEKHYPGCAAHGFLFLFLPPWRPWTEAMKGSHGEWAEVEETSHSILSPPSTWTVLHRFGLPQQWLGCVAPPTGPVMSSLNAYSTNSTCMKGEQNSNLCQIEEGYAIYIWRLEKMSINILIMSRQW